MGKGRGTGQVIGEPYQTIEQGSKWIEVSTGNRIVVLGLWATIDALGESTCVRYRYNGHLNSEPLESFAFAIRDGELVEVKE